MAHAPFGVVRGCGLFETTTRGHDTFVTAQGHAPFGAVREHNSCVVARGCVPMAKWYYQFGAATEAAQLGQAMECDPFEAARGCDQFVGDAELVLVIEGVPCGATKTGVHLGLERGCLPY